jgi:hypothetical protein
MAFPNHCCRVQTHAFEERHVRPRTTVTPPSDEKTCADFGYQCSHSRTQTEGGSNVAQLSADGMAALADLDQTGPP